MSRIDTVVSDPHPFPSLRRLSFLASRLWPRHARNGVHASTDATPCDENFARPGISGHDVQLDDVQPDDVPPDDAYIQYALRGNAVPFHYLATADLGRQSPGEGGKDFRGYFRRTFPDLVRAFSCKHGNIIKIAYGLSKDTKYAGLVLLTEQNDLEVLYRGIPPRLLDFERLIDRCNNLATEGKEILSGKDTSYGSVRIIAERLFDVVSGLLSAIAAEVDREYLAATHGAGDATLHQRSTVGIGPNGTSTEKSRADDLDGILGVYTNLFGDTERYYEITARREALTKYLEGTLIGLSMSGVGLVLFTILAYVFGYHPDQLIACLILGALGAIVSVFQRISSDSLDIKFRSRQINLRMLGSLRPFIGSLFALGVYLIIKSAFLPIKMPDEATLSIYFTSAIAFVAGFSERLAQDMLLSTEGVLVQKARGKSKPDTGRAQS